MKTSLIAFGALLGLVSAQHAVVHNDCAGTVYVQSFPYDGSAAGPLTTLTKGETFSEKFRASGSTVKIAKTKTLTTPLFFGYSLTSSPNYAYYEFSSEWGNPFAADANSLSPGAGCMDFDCAANDAACYSTPAHKKVYGCPRPVNLTATLCQ
ncbi:hypothetical protein N7510_004077 [Penicillium lagena]|uniref:uncharacterized protein n=1 Tax=Penicillium lagena TaxID=94218 RepID=UPI002540B754|nr:uncharacterized protein N7510_004077 [Penicillium lagena]KAJ5620093.1 hypothetical protein N7510_004077 [Penicillium lagena]